MSNYRTPPPGSTEDLWGLLRLAAIAATVITTLGFVTSRRSTGNLRAFTTLASVATTIYAHTAAPPRCAICGRRHSQATAGVYHSLNGCH